MIIDFRIDFGYSMLYTRRYSHPICVWDGHMDCRHGKILRMYKLEYPFNYSGPAYDAEETPLPNHSWQITTRRNLAGLRIIAEVTDNSIFVFHSSMGDFEIPYERIAREKYFNIPVGDSEIHSSLIINESNYYWFQPSFRPEQQVFHPADMNLLRKNHFRMDCAWLPPQGEVDFIINVPNADCVPDQIAEGLLHLVVMAASAPHNGTPDSVHDQFPMALALDGQNIDVFDQYLRDHDLTMQIMTDIWRRFAVSPGKHTLTLKNLHQFFYLTLHKVIFEVKSTRHLQMTLPHWCLCNETYTGKIYATQADTVSLEFQNQEMQLELKSGWNEFDFVLSQSGQNIEFCAISGTVQSSEIIPEVYALSQEAPIVKVGCDMTTVPHDDNGFMDWLLDYIVRTQMGNFILFRPFHYEKVDNFVMTKANAKSMARFGSFCKQHRLYAELASSFIEPDIVKTAGNFFRAAGKHEYPGLSYQAKSRPPFRSYDLKEAAEKFISCLRENIQKTRQFSPMVSYGDASGAARYCYLAGVDFLRSETLVGHTMHLCSLARPAAESLGKGDWGVHIAIQHNLQPFTKDHLGLFFVSLLQPWMMGAKVFDEEDSLFCLFKEERQSWDDYCTKGKREMLRWFYRFVQTHPRQGDPVRNFASIEGRYAPPFHSFNAYSDRDCSIWGAFGNESEQWQYREPEKIRLVLEMLMPGYFLDPFKQKHEKTRFFFSGTPYGDFDQVPIEADENYLSKYKLLLLGGWNTMQAEDHQKLKDYVINGGTLFTGIMQFVTDTSRDFLPDTTNAKLYRDGDLSELCGVKILGAGPEFSGQWQTAQKTTFNQDELSSLPTFPEQYDLSCRIADIELTDAEVTVWDGENGLPLIIRKKIGKGCVYLLTLWAYMGQKQTLELVTSYLERLLKDVRPDIRVQNADNDVFWSTWNDGSLYMLNINWSRPGSHKDVRIITPETQFDMQLAERHAYIIYTLPFGAFYLQNNSHAEIIQTDDEQAEIKLFGSSQDTLYFHEGTDSPPVKHVVEFNNHATEIILILNKSQLKAKK